MRTNQDLPLDHLGTLGRKVEQPKPAAPDVVKPFERGDHSAGLISDHSKALESVADTLRRKAGVIVDEQCDFSSELADPYMQQILGCI